jgi:hypothetical protein
MQIRKVREKRWMWNENEWNDIEFWISDEREKNLNFKFGKTLGTEKVGKEPFLKPFSSQPV